MLSRLEGGGVGAPHGIVTQSLYDANCLSHERAQKDGVRIRTNAEFAAKFALARYVAMSLELITAGVLACLFGLIALLPSFDGNWDR
jgi:hypothetical protein